MSMYYMQDSRGVVGNCMLFWRHSGGYTTDIGKAKLWTHDDAMRQHRERATDIPWPQFYIEDKARLRVDIDDTDKADAMLAERERSQ